MKIRRRRILSALMAGIIGVSSCFGLTASAFAAGTTPLAEMENENSTAASGNNSFERAEYISISSLLNKTYPYLLGDFKGNENFTDTVDYYTFSITKNTGSKGRVAISLENIPSGHNYNLYLYNSSHTLIASSTKSGNSNEVIKTPEITGSTTYYVKVEAVTVPDPAASSYRIKVNEYMTTKTVTASLTPRTLVTTKDTWSADASIDESKLPADATIVSAKVSATKPSTTAAYNHMLRVKIGKNGTYVPVTWKSGDIAVPELVGQNCCGTWYAGFKASMLSGVSALDSISMSSFKLIIEYEYDSLK